MIVPLPIKAIAPTDQDVTDHDRAHGATYLRLLDADDAGAAWEDAARNVLGLDPAADPLAARRMWQSHLDRARWMTTTGFRLLSGAGRPRKSADP